MKRSNYILAILMALFPLTMMGTYRSGKAMNPEAEISTPGFSSFSTPLPVDIDGLADHSRITDPWQREADRDAMRRNSDSFRKTALKTASAKKEAEQLHTVTVKFEGEYEPYFAIYHPDFFEESQMATWMELENEGGSPDIYYFQVPSGMYDIFAQVWTMIEGYSMEFTVNLVHEDVEINQDIEIVFSKDELTEKIEFAPVLRNGDIAILPSETITPEGEIVDYDDTNANTAKVIYNYFLFKEGCENIASAYLMSYSFDGGNRELFLCNKLSSKYHLIYQYYVVTNDEEIEISVGDNTKFESGLLYNSYEYFKEYIFPDYSKTPIFNELGILKNYSELTSTLWKDNVQMTGVGISFESDKPSVFACFPPMENNPFNIKQVLTPNGIQFQAKINRRVISQGIYGLPAYYNGEEWKYINQNHK